MSTTERSYGAKYESTKNLRRPEIAKLVRKDIKAAVEASELPRGKYSVTCKSFAGGGSIDVRISDLELGGERLMNAGRIRWDLENPHSGHWDCPSDYRWQHSDWARGVKAAVEKMLGAYNYDGSDSMTDYFDVRFYGHADFETRWEREVEAREVELVKAEIEAEKVARAARVLERAQTVPAPAPAQNDVAPTSAQESFLDAIGAL